MKILLIEDNEVEAKLLKLLFHRAQVADLQWLHAACLQEALNLLQNNSIDIIFTDLSLPDSQGLETISQLCEKAGAVPVILLSGNEDLEIAKSAKKLGVKECLIKGRSSKQTLLAALERALSAA